jgi:hypothetical protein
LIDELAVYIDAAGAQAPLRAMAQALQQRLEEWRALGAEVVQTCQRDVQEIGAMSVDFLAYSAYVLVGGLWLQAAVRAQAMLDAGTDEPAFYRAKLQSADFYWRRVLPRASGHRESLLGGAQCLMAMEAADFAF